jgi:hypothetical protein
MASKLNEAIFASLIKNALSHNSAYHGHVIFLAQEERLFYPALAFLHQ